MSFALPVPISHVLHIGAGYGSDIPSYTAAGLSQIILVEADPEAAVYLKTIADNTPGTQVIQAAISADPTARAFYRTSFSELNSLSRPERLAALFPNLRILSDDPVLPVNPAALLDQLELPQDGMGLLVIEAPGEAAGILEELEQADRLADFSVIRIQDGREALYENALALEEIQARLAGMSYVSWIEPQPEDPDRPHLAGLRIEGKAKLEADLQKKSDQLEMLTTALQESETRAELTEADRDKQRTELDLLKEQYDTLSAEAKRLRQEIETRDKQIDEISENADNGWKSARKASETADSVRSDLAVALRMQAIAQSDLRQLEKRYSESEQAREAQAALLQKLTPRLQQAARQLQEIAVIEKPRKRDAMSAPSSKSKKGGSGKQTSGSKKKK